MIFSILSLLPLSWFHVFLWVLHSQLLPFLHREKPSFTLLSGNMKNCSTLIFIVGANWGKGTDPSFRRVWRIQKEEMDAPSVKPGAFRRRRQTLLPSSQTCSDAGSGLSFRQVWRIRSEKTDSPSVKSDTFRRKLTPLLRILTHPRKSRTRLVPSPAEPLFVSLFINVRNRQVRCSCECLQKFE
jgi:hypothetical protein